MTSANDLLDAGIVDMIREDYGRVLKNIIALMKAVGATADVCRGTSCGRRIYFIKHANGRVTPYDADGTNHFITCPNAKSFKERNNK